MKGFSSLVVIQICTFTPPSMSLFSCFKFLISLLTFSTRPSNASQGVVEFTQAAKLGPFPMSIINIGKHSIGCVVIVNGLLVIGNDPTIRLIFRPPGPVSLIVENSTLATQLKPFPSPIADFTGDLLSLFIIYLGLIKLAQFVISTAQVTMRHRL